jgi:DNA adenine methylase
LKKAKPLLRWAGSKARVLSQIESAVPLYSGKYIELFAGSACLYFNQNVQAKGVIADANKPLISFYRHAKRNPGRLYDEFVSIDRTKESYLRARTLYNQSKPSFYRAVLFYYLNRNCFNGIYRTNLKGQFNVPFAASRVAKYPSKEEFVERANMLRECRLICGDFEAVAVSNVERGDFVYLDPPYYIPEQRIFLEYSADHFGEQDFFRLSNVLVDIERKGAKFLLSYPDCTLSKRLARQWNSGFVDATRSISAKTSSRKKVLERLISNY